MREIYKIRSYISYRNFIFGRSENYRRNKLLRYHFSCLRTPSQTQFMYLKNLRNVPVGRGLYGINYQIGIANCSKINFGELKFLILSSIPGGIYFTKGICCKFHPNLSKHFSNVPFLIVSLMNISNASEKYYKASFSVLP